MQDVLETLGVQAGHAGASTGRWIETSGAEIVSSNPATGEPLGSVKVASAAEYERIVEEAGRRFDSWRMMPAPKRGEIVRELGDELRRLKDPLGRLVSLECGKVLSEGLGEVQEMIDICDFAVGLSRQLYGLTMHSERPRHRMYEQWHPLGVGRRDHRRLQFPGRGLVLERGHRRRLRRRRCCGSRRRRTPLTAFAVQQDLQSKVMKQRTTVGPASSTW